MKTYLTYGFGIALGGALITMVLYLLGFHNDPSKVGTAQWIGGVAALAVTVIGIVLGTQAKRATVPPTEDFGYGRAFGAGVAISFFCSVFSAIFNFLYAQVINPAFRDVMMQAQTAKWEAAGLSSAQIEQAQHMMQMMGSPVVQCVFAIIFGVVIGSIISLITAACLKRPATAEVVVTT